MAATNDDDDADNGSGGFFGKQDGTAATVDVTANVAAIVAAIVAADLLSVTAQPSFFFFRL